MPRHLILFWVRGIRRYTESSEDKTLHVCSLKSNIIGNILSIHKIHLFQRKEKNNTWDGYLKLNIDQVPGNGHFLFQSKMWSAGVVDQPWQTVSQNSQLWTKKTSDCMYCTHRQLVDHFLQNTNWNFANCTRSNNDSLKVLQ